jgi:putative sigma-54 modulation protein
MLIQVRGAGLELNEAHRDSIVEKIEDALERFSARITRVNVFLADVNGPKSGIDKSLRIVIQIRKLPLIVVEEKGEDWSAVLDAASERAVHTVSRQTHRSRSLMSRTKLAGGSDSPLAAEISESAFQ